MSIQQEAQRLDPSGKISLFTLDLSPVGGMAFNFVMAAKQAEAVTFGGVVYNPIDCKFDGLETTGQGAYPTPRLTVSNVDGLVQALVNTYGDLNGCVLTRIRTFTRFLDGSPEADKNAFFGPDIFRLERKALEGSAQIEWELSASIDQEGKQIPGRVAIRDTCLWRYRQVKPNGAGFDYAKAQCPYTGSKFYDINDQEVSTREEDVPSRRLSCCRVRFGANKPLPFGGFPGLLRSNQ